MLTLVSIPKPFHGHIATIQRNALRSWTRLGPEVEICLCGEDPGTREAAAELGIRHVPVIGRNAQGTPLLSDVLAQAERLATCGILGYVNADIVLLGDFLAAAREAVRRKRRFLLVGQRWDIDIRDPLSFGEDWEPALRARLAAEGRLHAVTGIDYFVFPRGLWGAIPPFAVGRSAWDNWLIYRARALGADVLDATEAVTAVHQNHDYAHIPGEAVWTGPEAAENLRLAGGDTHLFNLLDATHRLTSAGCRRALSRPYLERHLVTLPLLHPRWTPVVRLVERLRRTVGKGREAWRGTSHTQEGGQS